MLVVVSGETCSLFTLVFHGNGRASIERKGVVVARWVTLCEVKEAPEAGKVIEVEREGVAICLANVNGQLSAIDNWCPHRRGPLGQGWLEGELVVCPWHSWAFNATTGVAEYPVGEQVRVFPLTVQGEDVLVEFE
jgi:nitrite reductase (NADH) small subunit